MRILAISGSLRAQSSNTTVLLAAAELAPAGVEVTLYGGLAGLPHFNPDLDTEPAISSVADWRAQLCSADGVLICSPEYAHGVPGVLKNALDWIVGSGELVEKKLGVLNARPGSTHADAALREILTVMTGRIVPEASVTLQLAGKKLDAAGMVADPQVSTLIRDAVAALVRAIEASRG